MAASTVLDWAGSGDEWVRLTGATLAGETYLTPSIACVAPTTIRTSIGATGTAWTRRALGTPRTTQLHAEQARLRTRMRPLHGATTRWTREGLRCDLRRLMNRDFWQYVRESRCAHGRLISEGVHNLQLMDLPLLCQQGEQKQAHKAYHSLGIKTTKLADLMTIEWTSSGVIVSKPNTMLGLLSPRKAEEFSHLTLDI
jgi:hypothetical protein